MRDQSNAHLREQCSIKINDDDVEKGIVMAVLLKKEIKKDRLISIDPSINNMGLAIWDLPTKKLLVHVLVHPKKYYTANEYDKSFSMLAQVRSYMTTYRVNRIIMEIPEYWAVGGFQARETGSMTKLMFVCGMIYSLRDQLEELKLVTPREWKGQLPKKVVEVRLRDHYLPHGVDLTQINDNVMDGISIGHFYIYGSV